MIKRILLDVDDTCNRLSMHVLKHVGCNVDPMAYYDFPVECGYDLLAAANKLHPTRKFELGEFWDSVTRDVWASTPVSHEFEWLLEACERMVGRENICILSGPTKDPDSLAGKLDWIHKHFPKWMHRQYLIGPRKHFCAHPEALLIDDCDANVDAFIEHGGNAILVPRPWNTLHEYETTPWLRSKLLEYLPEGSSIYA